MLSHAYSSGKGHEKQGKLDEALESYKKSLVIREESTGPDRQWEC